MSINSFKQFAAVVPELSIDKILDYGIPTDFEGKILPGSLVGIKIRGHMRQGYVLEIKDTPSFTPVSPISQLISEKPLLSKALMQLAFWIAKYYSSPLRQVLKIMLPAPLRKDGKHKEQLYVMRAITREKMVDACKKMREKLPVQAAILDEMLLAEKGMLLTELLEAAEASRSSVDSLVKKGLLAVDIVRIDRSPLLNEEYFKTKPKTLNSEQSESLNAIQKSIEHNLFEVHLIHGVTGSGKTEVYLQAIEKTLALNKGVIMLVPEISLTAQTIERFRSRFENKIAILHHRLSQGERFDEWHRIEKGEAKIVIGARSAIFSPVPNLGLIIVDEEHENAYKQNEETPCYHARDISVVRGKIENAVVVLGSATPSLESFYNAKTGKYRLASLQKRADKASSLPEVTIVDMRLEREKAKGASPAFSEALLNEIKKRTETGEQSILFLNRRGYYTTLICQECKEVTGCKHCDVSLTFHKGENSLTCHLCGYGISPPPRSCNKCKSETIKYRGAGTEQIQKSLHAILPDIRTIRIDADTTKHKGSHQKLLREFGSGKADVLIGTQMIAKGLHFPQVTLVGVLNSDGALNIPDFRASETVFQLITQVAGRAGRGETKGKVLIQTYLPENETIKLASQHDYLSFYENEIAVREMFQYPPFTHLAKIIFSGKNQKEVLETAEKIRAKLIEIMPPSFELNPALPTGHARVKDEFRFQFLVKGKNMLQLNRALEQILLKNPLPRTIRINIDIDPTSTFF